MLKNDDIVEILKRLKHVVFLITLNWYRFYKAPVIYFKSAVY